MICNRAGVAHLVERHLAKVEVEGSSPFARSKKEESRFMQKLLKSKPSTSTVEQMSAVRRT